MELSDYLQKVARKGAIRHVQTGKNVDQPAHLAHVVAIHSTQSSEGPTKFWG